MPQQIDFDPNVDYYKALGVTEKATADEIKKAYRKLAKQYHPDSTGGDKAKEARFKDVQGAYDVLGDPKKRGLYDQIRANGGMPNMGGRGGFPGGFTYTSTGGGPGLFDLGDLFGQFFTNARAGGGGSRVHVEHFEDDGRRRRSRRDVDDAEFEQKVKASDGSWLRAEGSDVYSDVRIPFDRAILGTVATVATIDGKAEVKVPPGTSSGKKLRLRGKGIPDRSGRVGDHYITVQIDVPGDLDEESKKQLIHLVTRLRKHKHTD
ncbi:MAG TPA: DnaJ domain-containing protein [Kofleriaceae bacterium]|nr:DnaJ domain-containing protein [Kofleriaceae bacterium]